ncbi:hypothetical protein F2Q68_00009440 [Brassica cretica]|uniref:DUF223 domain-containing protein n=1 Tax=Brassica cretica TaxID=69181 RepID=A0A8S9KQ28_BRACR|nr:hypothetical protein F2Q68_00009440 [Brassica cretica]
MEVGSGGAETASYFDAQISEIFGLSGLFSRSSSICLHVVTSGGVSWPDVWSFFLCALQQALPRAGSGPLGLSSVGFVVAPVQISFNHLLENVSLCLSGSSNRRPGVRHSTFESLRLGRSSQSIASGFLHFWDSLNFKKDMEFVGITVLFLDEKLNSVIHGFTPIGRANHYMPSLKAGSIVKVERFEVARCSSMFKINDHSFLIRFISLTIIDEVITGAPEINLLSRLDCSTIFK